MNPSDAPSTAAGEPAVQVTEAADPRRWTAVAQTGDARITLHSTRDPLGEARRQLDGIAGDAPAAIAIAGAGLGFIVEAARERWPHARIAVAEPSAALAAHARRRTPALFEGSDPVRVVVGPEFAGADDLWRLFDTIDSQPPLVVHPVVSRVMPGATARAVAVLRRAMSSGRLNARARRENAGRYLLNTLRNLPQLAAGLDPAAMAGAFKGVPAVVVGAGPSLDDTIEALRACANRALVIAADTALRPLLAAGIDPALTVAVDPTDLNARHLTDLPSRSATWLLAESSVDPHALASFPNRATFRVAAHHPWPWLEECGVTRGLVRVWGSVLTAAFDLAVTLGCDPIVFTGADLAFTGGRPYCRGTTWESDWAPLVYQGVSLRRLWDRHLSSRQTVTVDDVRGRPVVSAPHLVQFRDWLVDRMRALPGRRFVNATGGGALIGGPLELRSLGAELGGAAVVAPIVRATLDEWSRSGWRAIDLRQPLDDLLRRDAREGPPAEWIAAAEGTVSIEAVRAALVGAREALSIEPMGRERGAAAFGPSEIGPRILMPPADRAARLRAALTGDRSVLDGVAPLDDVAGTAMAQADAALDTLLSSASDLTVAVRDESVHLAGASLQPPSLSFTWTRDALPHVERIEEALALAPLRPHEPDRRPAAYWRAPIDPIETGPRLASAVSLTVDQRARLTLVRQWLALAGGRDDAVRAACLRTRRLIDAIEAALATPPLVSSDPAAIAVHGLTHVPWQLPLAPDAFMRELTGCLAGVTDDARGAIARSAPRRTRIHLEAAASAAESTDPRLAFFRDGLPRLDPEILTDGRLGRSWHCASLDAESAIVTPSGARSSFRLAADGLHARQPWPHAIGGEATWGRDGGAIAWHQHESRLMRRAHEDAAPVICDAPFHPVRPLVLPDGSSFWCAVEGGLWHWRADGSLALLIATPPMSGLERDGDALILHPVERSDRGALRRVRLTTAWRYVPGDAALRAIPLDRAGQRSTASVRERWTAVAHPFADLIRVRHARGRAFDLACRYPWSAAWAGDSLIVCDSAGFVLLFRDLLARVRELAPGLPSDRA